MESPDETLVALVADLHLGNHQQFAGRVEAGMNWRARTCVAALDHAVDAASYDDARVFIVAGDLFDTDEPTPAMIAAAQQAFIVGVHGDRPHTYFVNGNHDMTSTADYHTAIAPLCGIVGSSVYDTHFVYHDKARVLMVGFQPGPAKDWLPAALPHISSTGAVLLVLHLGLEHDGTPPWLRGAHDSIHVDELAKLCKERGITHVAAGNWHEKWHAIVDGVEMMQIGALVPTGFDNCGIEEYGHVAYWRTDGHKAKFIPGVVVSGPRFLKAKTLEKLDHYRKALDPDEDGNTYFIHAELASHEYFSARERLIAMEAAGLVAGWKITRTKAEVREAADKAAQAVTSSSNLREALFDWVLEMDLEPGVDRKSVLETARACLEGTLEEATALSERH